jgi:hypothetical protein
MIHLALIASAIGYRHMAALARPVSTWKVWGVFFSLVALAYVFT